MSWQLRMVLFVAALAVIYFLGTSLFSAARMGRLFYPMMKSVFHVSEPHQLFHYLTVVRLTAHYLEYFLLFLLLAWLVGLRPLTALILCLILAGADEGHQYFLPDRTCSPRDLGFDTAGALTAFILTITARRILATPRPDAKLASEPAKQASA
jgi:VanZ family protein